MSVTPASGAQDTVNEFVFLYALGGFTWEPGRSVSTVVQVSFADGPASRFPARSSAVVANSYTPSADAVNMNWPKFPAGWTAYWTQTALPPVRYQRVMLPSPVPFPSEAVYQTENVRALSYVGKEPAAEVGAVLSTITTDSVWLVPMSTDRGAFANEYGGHGPLTWVRLPVGYAASM